METVGAEQCKEAKQPTEAKRAAPLSSSVQAHLGRASHFADGKTRNWTLFFFYRILNQAEVDADVKRLVAVASEKDADNKKAALSTFLWALADPALMNAGLVEQKLAEDEAGADAPADLFFAWLAQLTNAQSSELQNLLSKYLSDANLPLPRFTSGSREASVQDLFYQMAALDAPFGFLPSEQLPAQMLRVFRAVISLFAGPDQFKDLFREYGQDAGNAGLAALSDGLAGVCLYEFLRHIAPAYLAPYPSGILRSEEEPEKCDKALDGALCWDPVPINFTFTYAGLKALQLDPATLASFPEAFRAGMAARAERLGDTGPSAPENWYGALGLESVHGYFTGGFLVGGKDKTAKARDWQRFRDEVRAFNDRTPELGWRLRLLVNALFRPAGIEIMHIELGEDPFEVDQHGHVHRLPYRREHFGFRDGISQPFVDLELQDPPPGGGTPDRDRSWSPVAPGEIYLNRQDEDGIVPQQPIPPSLRDGSTFVVFRKLEQDVPRFRAFLSKQRPGDKEAQRKLSAQFMGRWPNGTPLVLSPDAPIDLGSDPGGLINDFLYAADDPDGANCPLGAHVRRSNPRDIGGTNDVRRHRILRRSIGYGGPLLPEGKLGDGNTRGLLFVAVNARIDLQFEVVQGIWINKGEFLGQAGLGRCPITGVHQGQPEDAFLKSGSVAPVTGIPRFVITRGGDYFFAPGLPALRDIARHCKFEIPGEKVPYRGYSMGDAKTPILFEADRLKNYAGAILSGLAPVVRVSLPSPNPPQDPISSRVVFAGRHKHVERVLSTKTRVVDGQDKIIYSIGPYQEAGRRISRCFDLIIGTEPGSPTAAKHKRMHDLLDAAWCKLREPGDLYARLDGIIGRSLEATLRRTGPSKRIDLVHDLPSTAVYGIVKEIFGTPGPNWLTELAIALPFAHQHVGELHPDWLAAQKRTVSNPAAATLQIWSIVLFADIVGNYDHQQELMALSLQAGSEFLTQLDMLLAEARSRPPTPHPRTMLEAFVALQSRFVPNPYSDPATYYGDVRMLLMELAGSAVAIIPTAFGAIMNSLLDFGIDLSLLIRVLLGHPMYKPTDPELAKGDGITRLIYETSRVNPVFNVLMRRCALSDDLKEGGAPLINEGEWVAALVAAANFDGDAFDKPKMFSLYPFVQGPPRYLDRYLLFGAQGGGRECWGKDRLALKVLIECVKAAGRLEGLRRVAGDGGKLQTLVGVNIGLNAHFASVLPDWKP
jgi:Dyp-type peroxidase family